MNANYVCPYCGKEIQKEEVLFWRTSKAQFVDNLRGNFLRRHGVDARANKYPRLYYQPRWDKDGNPENIIREDENHFPTVLEDYTDKGIKPEDLGSQGFSSGSGFNDSFDDMEESYSDSSETEREKVKIPGRACPHCHCALPPQFGMIPSCHVAMFGGRASGKTSYLVNLFQQVSTQLAKNNLGSLELAEESKSFMDPKIKYYEENNTVQATAADDGLLPIVCRFAGHDQESFLIFYDIAGEGTINPEYMANHKGIACCESLLLMVDPNMFDYGTYIAEWVANHPNENRDTSECCKDTVDDFLNIAGSYCTIYGESIRNIICVVTKLDMLLEAESASFGTGNIELLTDTENKHRDAVKLSVLHTVQTELNTFISKRFHIDLVQKIKEIFGSDKKVMLLGVSTSTIEKGKNGTRYSFNPDSAAIKNKHRIAEPLFAILMLFGLVNAQKPDKSIVRFNPSTDSQTVLQAAPAEPNPGFWGKIFGKKKKK